MVVHKPSPESTAHARAVAKADPEHGRKISEGRARKKVARRTVQLIRQAVPDLDVVLGDQIRAIVIVIEAADSSEFDDVLD